LMNISTPPASNIIESIFPFIFAQSMSIYNAALRGECRLNQLSADYFHHQKPPHTKNATRHESRLNALLCLSFNGLGLTRTKINSTLIYKQKPKRRKQK
ncbi:hypothetical protein, partial [Vibrio vulnificus]|uniref:hypothetical protein n=1 Tax=Vibrio vulnificus TaxID=672 RepID=UPI0021155304